MSVHPHSLSLSNLFLLCLGYNDLYTDCYYMNGPCGDNFDNAPPYQSIVR